MFKKVLFTGLVAMVAASAALADDNTGASAAAVKATPMAPIGEAAVHSAVVASDATVVRGTRGTTAAVVGTASYEVIFRKVMTGCVFNATLGTTSTGTAPAGMATTAQRAGKPNGVWVQTFDTAGNLTPRDFHLVVTCP